MKLLWLQSGGCGGCTMSVLGAEAPDSSRRSGAPASTFSGTRRFPRKPGLRSSISFRAILDGRQVLDVLCIEGSLLLGPNGTGRFHMMAGTGRPMIDWVRALSACARHVVAVGTCAAFGGITAAGINPADACGLQYDGRQKGGLLGPGFMARGGLPVVNVAGCPTHPNWVTESLMLLAGGDLAAGDLDQYQRPRFYADHLVHHGCPRNEYYEYKASAHKPSDLGCMMEHMGCLGTQAHADCNTRLWNGEGSCTRGGYACINCTAPEFEEPGHMFLETPKLAGIPIGLPTDMPKAWFVALSSLAKAATPDRVRRNAATDRIVVPPTVHEKRKR